MRMVCRSSDRSWSSGRSASECVSGPSSEPWDFSRGLSVFGSVIAASVLLLGELRIAAR